MNLFICWNAHTSITKYSLISTNPYCPKCVTPLRHHIQIPHFHKTSDPLVSSTLVSWFCSWTSKYICQPVFVATCSKLIKMWGLLWDCNICTPKVHFFLRQKLGFGELHKSAPCSWLKLVAAMVTFILFLGVTLVPNGQGFRVSFTSRWGRVGSP
jgi:hypothetical protein